MSLIVCRKCGGDHLTMKCGKNKDEKTVEKIEEKQENNINNQEKIEEAKENFEESKEKIKGTKDKFEEATETRYEPRISYRVKVSELPNDITEDEMMELCNNWGYITKLKVIN